MNFHILQTLLWQLFSLSERSTYTALLLLQQQKISQVIYNVEESDLGPFSDALSSARLLLGISLPE